MRNLGCIPTNKYVTDISLVKDMEYACINKSSVLLYPEAGYSFDGLKQPCQIQFLDLLSFESSCCDD